MLIKHREVCLSILMFWTLLIAFVPAQAQKIRAVSGEALLAEVNSALYSGDYFQAYRVSLNLSQKFPAVFAKFGIVGFIQSLFAIGTPETIEKECNKIVLSRLSMRSSAAYLCGQDYLEHKDYKRAIRYLQTITSDEKFYIPSRILLSTVFLARGDASSAKGALAAAPDAQYEKAGLNDIYNVTRARLAVYENKFEEAIKLYQLISSDSNYYSDTLLESAWVFFKQRKLESAIVLADVVISNYEGMEKKIKSINVSAAAYFKARHIKAYAMLLQKRIAEAEQQFVSLKQDFTNFRTQRLAFPSLDKMVEKMTVDVKNWKDPRNPPGDLGKAIDVIADWRGLDVKKSLEREIKYQVALGKELDRFTKLGGAVSGTEAYFENLRNLQKKLADNTAAEVRPTVVKTISAMDTFGLKADLGRLEVVWLNRADGIRSLDQVLENYREQVGALNEFEEM